jgi:hypothetical protein
MWLKYKSGFIGFVVLLGLVILFKFIEGKRKVRELEPDKKI